MFRGWQTIASDWKCKPGGVVGDRVMCKPSHLAPLALSQRDFLLSPSSHPLADHSPGSAEPLYDSRCCHLPWGEATHLIREECWPCRRCLLCLLLRSPPQDPVRAEDVPSGEVSGLQWWLRRSLVPRVQPDLGHHARDHYLSQWPQWDRTSGGLWPNLCRWRSRDIPEGNASSGGTLPSWGFRAQLG